nr:hypothetical protein CFP56_28725 [Quercus suber]
MGNQYKMLPFLRSIIVTFIVMRSKIVPSSHTLTVVMHSIVVLSDVDITSCRLLLPAKYEIKSDFTHTRDYFSDDDSFCRCDNVRIAVSSLATDSNLKESNCS